MRKRDPALLLLVCVVVGGGVVLQFMTRHAQLARDATLGAIDTPEQVRFYQDLAASALAASAPETFGGGPAALPAELFVRLSTRLAVRLRGALSSVGERTAFTMFEQRLCYDAARPPRGGGAET